MMNMVRTVISVDLNKAPREQPTHVTHNRWHPDIPAVAKVTPGEVFRVECLDWTGGQIKNNDSADDIRDLDLSSCHNLFGPVCIEGAEPGDYVEIEILEIQPLPGHEWGYTGIFDINNGGGFLDTHYKSAAKAIWDLDGIYATSRHIPGVKFAGIIHPGIIGTAPSKELLQKWNKREFDLVSTDSNRIPPLAYLPNSNGSLMGQLEKTDPTKARQAAAEAARTIPPREHGGNCDIKNLSRGSKLWLPVYVPGANLSVGDLHFSEGDGEISFCGAIEMAGAITMRANVIKKGVSLHGNLSMPIFMPGPVQPQFSRYLTFEGISVDENGKQHYLDASVAFKQAVLNCIAYFKRFGYTGEQIYLLLSACPCEGRVNSIVDSPNACCSLAVPTEIFYFDVVPKSGGHPTIVSAKCPVSERISK